MQWHRLGILVHRVSPDLSDFGFLHVSSDGVEKRRQEGVFRTNCIDCLDRTNVVQGLFAKHVLHDQLVVSSLFLITGWKSLITKGLYTRIVYLCDNYMKKCILKENICDDVL